MILTTKNVAVEPFPDMSIKTTAQGAGTVKVVRIENKVTLTRLYVVFPSEDGRFSPGDGVLVRSDLFVQPFAKERHELDGKSFILLPENYVEAIIR
jgi:hypothetical protein